MNNTDADARQFEQWFTTCFKDVDTGARGISLVGNLTFTRMYLAWQASRKATLEECLSIQDVNKVMHVDVIAYWKAIRGLLPNG